MDHLVAHDRLAHQSRTVLRLGQMLLAFGASAFRVKSSMARLAKALGIDEHHAQVTYTEIVATAYAHGTFRTELAEQRSMRVNAHRIDMLCNYVNSLDGRQVSAEEVNKVLEEIGEVPALYGWLLNGLASGVACAGFAFLNQGGWVECAVVLVAAFFGQLLRREMMHRRMNQFGVWMVCGSVAAAIYALLVTALHWFGSVEDTHQAGLISAVLFLVPGFPLVTGIIDLVRQDFGAGIGRLVHVFMLVVSAGITVWLVSWIFGWSMQPDSVQILPWYALYGLRLAASFIAAFGFAMLFNSPLKVCAAAAAVGMIVNVARLWVIEEARMPVQIAVGLAAVAAGLLAAAIASRLPYSRVTLSVPAVVIMIPGVPLYRSLALLNDGEVSAALAAMSEISFTIISIGVGLAVARMLTDQNWLVERPKVVPRLRAGTHQLPR